jgi:tetratricopeptide (TPR) repeat protein
MALGKEKNQSKYYNEAIGDLKQAIKIDDSQCDYFTSLGDAYFAIGNIGESYSALQKALTIDDKNLEASLKMAEISYVSHNYDRAIESLNTVTAQDKDNQTALFMKGLIYKENQDTANAVFYFRRLTELYPDFAPAYEELGMLYSQHRNKLGLEYLTTALRLDSTNINVLYAIAQTYQDVEDAENATYYYVRMLELDPQNKYAWFNRGRMEMELYEDYNNAVDFFSKAIDCDPNFAEAHYNRGLSYELMGDKAKAKECYDRAKELGFEK